MPDRLRIVIATPADDDHGAKEIARALRDAGMEVVYTGPRQTPDQIVRTVVQEDADAVGLATSHADPIRRTLELLGEQGIDEVVVFGIGTMPDGEGGATVFASGATAEDVVDWVRTNVAVSA